MAYPYFDVIHRDTSPGKVFDLGVELDNYDGSIYIRTPDIEEMARTLGMMTKEEADKLRAENAELRRQINKLPVVQEELKSGLDDLVARFYANLNSVDSSTDVPEHNEPQDDRESEETKPTSVRPFDF